MAPSPRRRGDHLLRRWREIIAITLSLVAMLCGISPPVHAEEQSAL